MAILGDYWRIAITILSIIGNIQFVNIYFWEIPKEVFMLSPTERIMALIEGSPYNAKQLLKELGLSNSTISDWKRGKGKPSSDAVVKFAEFFGVTTDYILLGNEKRERAENEFPKPVLLSELEFEVIKAYRELSNEKMEMILDSLRIEKRDVSPTLESIKRKRA